MYAYSVLVGSLGIASWLYHSIDEYEYAAFDRAMSLGLIGTNIVLCVLGGFAKPYFGIVCILIPVSIYFIKRREHKDFNHSMWHITSALICTVSLMTYYFGMK
jgi:hypothetical protein